MLTSKLGISDLVDVDIRGKRVLMRVDYNVLILKGKVSQTTRITATIPTINALFDRGAKSIVLMSHLGKPNGEHVERFSLHPVAELLGKFLNRDVKFLNECTGSKVEEACSRLPQGAVALLENLRFHPEEEGIATSYRPDVRATKVASFRASLAKLGDIYVNDAFGTAHRAHSSMVGISLPIRVAGLLLEKELEYISKVIENPKRPVLAILAGGNTKDKIPLILNLLDKVDMMIIGGGMAYTFLKVSRNMEIGSSKFDAEGAALVPSILEKARERNIELIMSEDFVCADSFRPYAQTKIASVEGGGVPLGWMGMDIGPKTIASFARVIAQARTIFWNGPMGVSGMPAFSAGSHAVLNLVAAATENGCVTIVGGGHTGLLVEESGKANMFSHVSTGGGATLELLEGKELPGVAALSNKTHAN